MLYPDEPKNVQIIANSMPLMSFLDDNPFRYKSPASLPRFLGFFVFPIHEQLHTLKLIGIAAALSLFSVSDPLLTPTSPFKNVSEY
uniref:Uncharacterized protein n=1 Tax=Candidatus Kentrum sp. LFY TaxID=2126342 RepID=A0A450V6M5_9GAMM|nr:MAG: hypothetical protein BECKLFY1418B_GA0070995_11881 [Candidatus Kentron sp. LFY]